MEIKQIASITEVSKSSWNSLMDGHYPFMLHEFLHALEESGCVSAQTGWQPQHVVVFENGELVAAMPMYLKGHSSGEFVFDHQWVYAFRQYGGEYYPKLLTAIPFTPCQGHRVVVKNTHDQKQVIADIVRHVKHLTELNGLSSWHCLFPNVEQTESMQSEGLLIREGVQFQWFNKDYGCFDDFLGDMTADKRKMIKRERRKVSEQGIEMIRVTGAEANDEQWRAFYRFYQATYYKHGMSAYLNPAFFELCSRMLPERILLVFARKAGNYVGAALSFVGQDTLYGRYWGCLEEFNVLHFEACYYQGLDFCIEHGLRRFDSGAQGEHKIARGFAPVTTYSAHWFLDQSFNKAVSRFLEREKDVVDVYKDDATRFLPFKKDAI